MKPGNPTQEQARNKGIGKVGEDGVENHGGVMGKNRFSTNGS